MTAANYGAIVVAEKLELLLNKIIESDKPFAFDIESGYSGPYRDKGSLLTYSPNWYLVGISFSASTNWAQYVPFGHDEGGNIDDIVRAARAFWRLLNTGNGVAHNGMFERNGCARFFRDNLWDDPEVGEEVRDANGFFPLRSDTMIEAFIASEYAPANTGGPGLGLKGLTKNIFHHEQVELKTFFMKPGAKTAKKDIRYSVLPVNTATTNYACEDAKWTYDLHVMNYDKVKDMFIFKVEMELQQVMADMEFEGLYLDWNAISKKAAEAAQFRDQLNEEIITELSRRLGENITLNLASPAQLSKVLYDRLHLPVKEHTATGAPSTSESAVRALAKEDPIIKRILEWREVSKLHGTYLHKYETELNYAGNGRAYPSHNQAGAGTGRFSVDRVSYQQWPKFYHYETTDKQHSFDLFGFRDFLIAPDEYRIVGYDFSQVELRVLAGLANETALLKAFADGVDIHKATAANMMGIPLEQVTKKLRAIGKTLNFAVVYGSGAQNIADMLTSPDNPVTKEDAEGYLEKYYAGFPKLRGWMDKKIVEGHETGYVETPFGRKFTVWEFTASNSYIRSKGDRMCVNAPVQGGAADYMKIGMVRARKAIKKAEKEGRIPVGGIRLIMTIHDALEFYVHESVSTQTVIDIISPVTSFPVEGFPEIKADWHEGYQWGAVAEINLTKDKQVTGYELAAELPWTKEEFSWEGDTLHEVLDQYYDWERQRFGWSYAHYQKRNPAWKPTGEAHQDKNLEADSTPMALATIEAPIQETQVQPEPVEPSTLEAFITLTEMPLDDQWSKFQDIFLNERSDSTGIPVTIETPEGNMKFDARYRITQQDQGEISMLLGGASLRLVDANDVSVDDLLDGVL